MSTSPRTAFWLVIALWAAGLGAAAQFAKIAVILPELQLFYGRDGVGTGFLVSLISVMGIVFGVVAGLLAIRIGLRRLVIGGLVLGGFVSLTQALMPPFSWMLATRFIEGVAHLAIVVAAPTLIAQITPKSGQAAALTLWGTFFGVAFALVALAAPPLMEMAGPAALFAAHGLYMVAFAAVLAVVLPAPSDDSYTITPLRLTGIIERHTAIYSSPWLGAAAVGWVLYTLTFVSLLAVLPQFIPAEDRLFATAWMPIASIISSMTIGVGLTRIMSAIAVVIIGFACSAVFAVLLLLFGADAWLSIALFAALGLVQGASFAAVPELNEDQADRTLANGGLAQMGNLGNTLGTPVLIAIIGFAGFAGIPLFLIACYIIAIGLHLWLAARRRALAAQPAAS